MGAARRLCVRAAVLAGMMSAIVSLALPGCQFPEYGMAAGGAGGGGGTADGGMTIDPGGAAGEGEESGAGGAAGSGVGGAGAGADASGAGGAEPATCPSASCVAAPSGLWRGPVAFWEGQAGAPVPDCPKDYTAPVDLHRELIVPPNTCACTCAAQDQGCQATLRIFPDKACGGTVCTTTLVPMGCNNVSGCPTSSQGSMRVENPTVSGGLCKPTISPIPTPTWRYNARLCEPNAGTCEGSSQVCAPRPAFPYATSLCVTSLIPEGVPLPDCPAQYPNVGKAFPEAFTDVRTCSDCFCSNVSGGSCSGTVSLTSGSTCAKGEDGATDGECTEFDVGPGSGVHPTHALGDYTVIPGTCGVASQPQRGGTVEESGSVTMVCCQ